MKCPKCDIEMTKGIGIDYHDPGGLGMFQHRLTAEEIKLIECDKCPKCGHSDDGRK